MKEDTNTEHNNDGKGNRSQIAFQYVALFLALAMVVGAVFLPLDQRTILAAGYTGVFIVALLSAVSLLPGPSGVAAFLAGGALNPLLVSIVAGTGSALGEATGYLAGYGSNSLLKTTGDLPDWLAKSKAYDWVQQKIVAWMSLHPFITLLAIAAIPNFFVDVGGLIAGRMKYPFLRFLVAMIIGKSIRFALGAYLGAWLLE